MEGTPKGHCEDCAFGTQCVVVWVTPVIVVVFTGRPFKGVPAGGEGGVCGQNGVDLSFFAVLCLLAYGDTAFKLYFSKAFGAHKRGVIMTLLVLFFPASGYLGTPKYCKTGKPLKMTNRRGFTPPQGGGAHVWRWCDFPSFIASFGQGLIFCLPKHWGTILL